MTEKDKQDIINEILLKHEENKRVASLPLEEFIKTIKNSSLYKDIEAGLED